MAIPCYAEPFSRPGKTLPCPSRILRHPSFASAAAALLTEESIVEIACGRVPNRHLFRVQFVPVQLGNAPQSQIADPETGVEVVSA